MKPLTMQGANSRIGANHRTLQIVFLDFSVQCSFADGPATESIFVILLRRRFDVVLAEDKGSQNDVSIDH